MSLDEYGSPSTPPREGGAPDDVMQRALAAIHTLRDRLDAHSEPVAVVGAGCRLPGGADDLDRLWALVRSGTDAVIDRPDAGPAGWLEGDVRDFDAEHFGISAHEADEIDPQHRLLLETGWVALEEAGLLPASGAGVGVFVGVSGSEFAMLPRAAPGPYTGTGAAVSVAAGRLAHTLGLHGPALAVDTACSSSLVAVHLAVQSLRRRECDAALAGGVNVLLAPGVSTALTEMGALSPSGRCRAFDAAADGYVRAEGAGMVALRRLSDAVADGAPILGVIRGSAVNQDGRTSGLTVPSGRAQRALIEQALADAGVAAADVGYLEAHGTGTPLGDPLELGALAAVFADRAEPLLVGALKSAIGHAEAASGIAGLLKTLMVLRHREAPPIVHLTEPNPRLELDSRPMRLPTRPTAWDGRFAGVSAFGFSGTNAHVVLAPAPEVAAAGSDTGPWVVPFSARDAASLTRWCSDLADQMEHHPEWTVGDLAHTLGARRPHFSVRRSIVVADREELIAQLRSVEPAGREIGAVAFLVGSAPDALARAETWRALGVCPGAVAGAGQGGLLAAHLAGVVDRAGLDELRAGRSVPLRHPDLRLVRAPGGGPVPADRVTDPAWWSAPAESSDLSAAVRHLREHGYRVLVDLGGAAEHATVDGTDVLVGLAALFESGVDPDWAALSSPGVRALPLPARPFRRRRHWLVAAPVAAAVPSSAGRPVPPGQTVDRMVVDHLDSPISQRLFEVLLDGCRQPDLLDNGGVVHIGHYADLLSAATDGGVVVAHDLRFREALSIRPGEPRRAQLVVEPDGGFVVAGRAERASGSWSEHLRGRLGYRSRTRRGATTPGAPAELRSRLDRRTEGDVFADSLRARGFVVGGTVERIEEVWWSPGEAVARLRGDTERHPGVLDAAVQLFAAAGGHLLGDDQLFITVGVDRYEVTVSGPSPSTQWCHLRLRPDECGDDELVGDLRLTDEDGTDVARATGIRVTPLRLPSGVRDAAVPRTAGDAAGTGDVPMTQRLLALVTDLLPGGAPDPDVSLGEQGLDSLAALELKRRIGAELDREVPMELLVQGPPVTVLARALAATGAGEAVVAAPAHRREPSRRPDSWLAHHRLTAGARVRLFCVPYGMKGASLYSGWASSFPAAVDVCPVQFPGKENRIEERPISDLADAVDAMATALRPHLDRPVALYGHSVGALVAYRVAHRLLADGYPVEHLFVGAFSAPSDRANPVHAQVLESFREFGYDDIPDLETLVSAGGERRAEYERKLADRFGLDITDELRRTVKPVGFADFQLVHSYRHDRAEKPLPVPVTAFHGAADTYVSEAEMREWGALTSGGFRLHVFPGDHFFLHPEQQEQEMVNIIGDALRTPARSAVHGG